uniref:proline-rich receptor-like protein kinase PERK2 n=1 Tax=Erigeron canadensis TaxID=72917 RepID=UPI001CB9A5A4|nr:proline-rich receptor-like protein kinase PERK2 [Erigeron canadensis]
MTDDDWLTAAISDTSVVAEFLLSLHLPTSPPPPPPPSSSSSKRRRPAPPPTWTIRRSRTQPQPLHQPPISNKSDTPRASPSTPLSWSRATSVSGGGCPPIPHVISGSKVMPPSETNSAKRSKKKKTLAALREEEVLLIEEQNLLKKKLAALQANCEKQRKENMSLKLMKLDIQQSNNHFEAVNERRDKVFLPDLNVPVGEDVIVGY